MPQAILAAVDGMYKADAKLITADLAAPARPAGNPCAAVKLRIRHPDGAKMTAVTVNGKQHTESDAAKEWIEIAKPAGTCHVEATFGMQN
ncbi:MAG: hypothetical protein ACE15C_12280 [Phycisphaerae bacterium]